METSLRNEIKVGIFATVGLILFCVSIIMLGGARSLFTRSYELKIHIPQAQGLGKGSVVTLVGLQIGNIDRITFAEGSSDVEVVVRIDKGVQNRITEGSKATVKTQGALGDKFIYIEPGPMGNPPLQDQALLEMDRTPDFIDLIASKGAELGEIVSVVKEVRLLFENINKDGRSGKLMGNLIESSDQFGKFLGEARETFRLMRTDMILPMASVLKKIDTGHGTLGALINDPSLHNRISSFFGDSPRNKFLKPIVRDSIQTNEKNK